MKLTVKKTAVFNIYLKTFKKTGRKERAENNSIRIENYRFNEYLAMNSSQAINNIEIFSRKGKLVSSLYDIDLQNVKLNTLALGDGIYYARVNSGREISVHEIEKVS